MSTAVMRGAKKIDLKKITDKALIICEAAGFKVRAQPDTDTDGVRVYLAYSSSMRHR